jgi:hypothetical protein
MVALIDRQAEDAKRPYQRLAENLERFYGPAIEHIARQKLAEENAQLSKRRASAVFLTGTVKWVESGGGLEVVDAAAAAEWAIANGLHAAVTYSLTLVGEAARDRARDEAQPARLGIAKTLLKERMKETGEVAAILPP